MQLHLQNILCIVVTEEVFHELMSPLKTILPSNILVIFVTLEVFHELISPLKSVLFSKDALHVSHRRSIP